MAGLGSTLIPPHLEFCLLPPGESQPAAVLVLFIALSTEVIVSCLLLGTHPVLPSWGFSSDGGDGWMEEEMKTGILDSQ